MFLLKQVTIFRRSLYILFYCLRQRFPVKLFPRSIFLPPKLIQLVDYSAEHPDAHSTPRRQRNGTYAVLFKSRHLTLRTRPPYIKHSGSAGVQFAVLETSPLARTCRSQH